MKYTKEQVLKIVADRMSLEFMFSCPPKVKMNKDGSVEIDKDHSFNKLKK